MKQIKKLKFDDTILLDYAVSLLKTNRKNLTVDLQKQLDIQHAVYKETVKKETKKPHPHLPDTKLFIEELRWSSPTADYTTTQHGRVKKYKIVKPKPVVPNVTIKKRRFIK